MDITAACDARAFRSLWILGAAKWCDGVIPSIFNGTGNLMKYDLKE
jgi:hypothetical protein